ncbi:MAG: 2-hydroxyacid dehydrogenase [Thermodesulfobacteriota bacterium]
MRVVLCGKSFPRAVTRLRELLPQDEVVRCPSQEVIRVGVDADVLIPLVHRLEPELLATTRARLIQQFGVGLEVVDVPVATERGIMVCNVPSDASVNAESTAEHAVFLMMGVARRIHECFGAFHSGMWGEPMGDALFGQTALIVGFGRVGRALARKLRGLGMRVLAIRRNPGSEMDKHVEMERIGCQGDFHAFAAEADFVVSTVVLTNETRGLFNRELFECMKPTAFVINASRGPVIDEDALLDALHTGQIAGAGLDVFAQEPLDPNSPLLSMKNVFATPHVAGVTRQNYEATSLIVADNINALREGHIPRFCVNAEELARRAAASLAQKLEVTVAG